MNIFKLKGAQIETVQCMLSQNSVNETTNFDQSKLSHSYVIYLLLYNEVM